MLNYQYLINNYVGIAPEVAAQYHRANTKRMAHVRPSLKRIKKETEKQIRTKLKEISYIREHDRISHSAKVADQKNRRYYICLMMGYYLYFDEFDPRTPPADSFYVIAGLEPSSLIVPAEKLRDIFQCIPAEACDLSDMRCRITKEDFLTGVRAYASILKRIKQKKS